MFQAEVKQPGCLFLSVCFEHKSELLFTYETQIERRKNIYLLKHCKIFGDCIQTLCHRYLYNPRETVFHEVPQQCRLIGREDEENKLALSVNGKSWIQCNKFCITITNTKILIRFPCISGGIIIYYGPTLANNENLHARYES